MKNAKFRKIDQHKNALCQMQSLERTLTLYVVAPFNVFTPICKETSRSKANMNHCFIVPARW